MVKNPPANAGDIRDVCSVPGSGKSPEGENGNPVQYLYLENPMDIGTWWAAVHEAAKNQTGLSMHTRHTFHMQKEPEKEWSYR